LVPQIGDQPCWVRRVAELGIGTAHDGRTPTSESLSNALTTALTPEARARSLELGQDVGPERLLEQVAAIAHPATAVASTIRTDGATVAARLLLEAFSQGRPRVGVNHRPSSPRQRARRQTASAAREPNRTARSTRPAISLAQSQARLASALSPRASARRSPPRDEHLQHADHGSPIARKLGRSLPSRSIPSPDVRRPASHLRARAPPFRPVEISFPAVESGCQAVETPQSRRNGRPLLALGRVRIPAPVPPTARLEPRARG
jgi:hypothetical protein